MIITDNVSDAARQGNHGGLESGRFGRRTDFDSGTVPHLTRMRENQLSSKKAFHRLLVNPELVIVSIVARLFVGVFAGWVFSFLGQITAK